LIFLADFASISLPLDRLLHIRFCARVASSSFFFSFIVHGLGKWGQVWYGFAFTVVQWEDHRSRKP